MKTHGHLLRQANKLISLTEANKSVNKEIILAKQKFESAENPAVQLYGLSQAGKSTFLSCLTLGEQFIPIGTGTATTAVVVELIYADSKSRSRAEIKWFTPEELQELVEQPLKYFIEDYESFSQDKGKSWLDLNITSIFQKDAPPSLASAKYRKHLWKMLTAAARARQSEMDKRIGEDNDLAISEIILRNYEKYIKEYREDFQQINDITEISKWTRQPIDWGDWNRRMPADYDFEELRSFFTKTVRLYAPAHQITNGLTILDSPGFGISNIHDRVCRSAQLGAEAVFLIIGQQIGQPQMNEIQQLSAGLKDNLFVIWNSKDNTEQQARELLEKALIRLQNEAGIVISKERTAVADLHLALRAMQWNKIQSNQKLTPHTENSLKERFSHIYNFDPSKHKIELGIKRELNKTIDKFISDFDSDLSENSLNDALRLSGWFEIERLLTGCKEIPQKQRELNFTVSLTNAAISYLEGFPTTTEIGKLNESIKALTNISHRLKTEIIKKNRKAMEEDLESEEYRVLDEFWNLISDPQELRNLKTGLEQKIKNSVHYSTVPTKIIAGIDDHVRARIGVWLKRFTEFTTTESKESVLAPFENATFEIAEWLKNEWTTRSGLTDNLELPSALKPNLDLGEFRQEFIDWNKRLAEKTFSGNWVDKYVKWMVVEKATDAWREVKSKANSWWNKTKNWWYQTDNEVSPPKETPSFDQPKAIREMKEKIDSYFSKDSLRSFYELGKDQTIFSEALTVRQGSSGDSLPDILSDFVIDYIKTKNITDLQERCDRIYSLWDNKVSHYLKASLNSALADWTNSIEPILSERAANLDSMSPQPISADVLNEIEEVFNSFDFSEFGNSSTINSAFNKFNRAVTARKISP